jgi:hypothetical protein
VTRIRANANTAVNNLVKTAPPTKAAPQPKASAPVDTFDSGAVGSSSTSDGGPAKSWDVSQVTPAEIAALKASKDPATRRLGNTLAGAKTSYADFIAAGAKIVVTTSQGNGGQPVVTLVPAGFDPSKPARVHTHYHGWNATVVDAMGHGSGTTARIAKVQQADPQTIFILPECSNAPAISAAGTPTFKTDWSNVSNEALTTADALAAAGIDPSQVQTRVVSAHSGGGAALANAITASKDGSGLACDRLELEDCLYGSEQQLKTWAGTSNGKAVQSVVYYHGTNDPQADKALGKDTAFGSRYLRINVDKLPMTDADRPTLLDASGKPLGKPGHPIRAYNADAHNRTIGEFMDDLGHPGFDHGISGRE